MQNKKLLDEINHSGRWFHAIRTRPIWAKIAVVDQMLETLEGSEHVQQGDFICRGESGDEWPQSGDDLARKYRPTESIDQNGWRKYEPKAGVEGVMAVQVEHAFEVETKWGRLRGKPGDFILKNYEDRDTDYPDDLWIVDQQLFNSTYSPVS